MNLIAIKKLSEVTLPANLTIEQSKVNDTVKSYSFYENGKFLFQISASYGVDFLIPAPPKTKEVWKLKAEFMGLGTSQQFDHEYEALDRKRELELEYGCASCKVTIGKELVPDEG